MIGTTKGSHDCERIVLRGNQFVLFFASLRNARSPDGVSWKHPSKDSTGLWPVRAKGVLQATFSIENGWETVLKDVPHGAFQSFLDKHCELVKIRPADLSLSQDVGK